MTLVEEKEFIQQMLIDFILSLSYIKKEPLADYEIELILDRYKIKRNELEVILNKIYSKEIKNLKSRRKNA